MKHIVTLILMALCLTATAQDPFVFAESQPDQFVLPSSSSDELSVYFRIVNTSTQPIDLDASRVYVSQASGHESFFCWDLCYGTATNQNSTSIQIMPGDTTKFEQYITFVPNGVNGITEVTMTFRQGQDDFTLSRTYSFNVGNVSSLDADAAQSMLSEPYPNPTQDQVSINFNGIEVGQGATIRVHNLLGQVMAQQAIAQPEGQATFSVGELPLGVYFLTLTIADRTLATRKFVVGQ